MPAAGTNGMANGLGRLLITRPRRQAEGFAQSLRRHGWSCSVEPVMRIVPEPSWEAPPAAPQAILITSPNAIPALRIAVARMATQPLIVAVGPDTAAAIRRAGFRHLLVGAGTAESVAETVITELRPGDGRLLHLAGHDVAGNLPEQLGRHGFQLDRVTVYRAVRSETLSHSCRSLLADGTVKAVMLFSPRTAAIFVELVARAGLERRLDAMTALVISANAAAAAGERWRDIRIAATPSRGAMLTLATGLAGDLSSRGSPSSE